MRPVAQLGRRWCRRGVEGGNRCTHSGPIRGRACYPHRGSDRRSPLESLGSHRDGPDACSPGEGRARRPGRWTGAEGAMYCQSTARVTLIRPPRRPTGRPRGSSPPPHMWDGPRRCPPPASLEGVGVGLGGLTTPNEPQTRDLISLSRTTRSGLGPPPNREVTPLDPRGAILGAAGQVSPGARRPLTVGRSGEGATDLGPKSGSLCPMESSGRFTQGQQRRTEPGLGLKPTTLGPRPGWRARRPPAGQVGSVPGGLTRIAVRVVPGPSNRGQVAIACIN